jgi:competence ComEA-like helix-hairpin-helix protein
MNWNPLHQALAIIIYTLAILVCVARHTEQGVVYKIGSEDNVGSELCTETKMGSGALRLLCGEGIDVNRDTAEDLQLLPGIGPVKARAIVESRLREGVFEGPTDLMRVRGIGPKTVDGLELWLEWSNIDDEH